MTELEEFQAHLEETLKQYVTTGKVVGAGGLAVLCAAVALVLVPGSPLAAALAGIGGNVVAGLLQQLYQQIWKQPGKDEQERFQLLALTIASRIEEDSQFRREVGGFLGTTQAFKIADQALRGNQAVHGWLLTEIHHDVVKYGADLAEIKTLLEQLLARQAPPRLPLQRPPRAANFVDRDTELEQLLADLQPGRTVTLCGLGGIGKSALAAEAVWKLAPGDLPPNAFPDGIVFHNFYRRPQADLALEAIARAYGEEPKPTPLDAAQRALSGRKALLLLDGTEEADNLSAVLGVAGGCGVIVTSRRHKDAPQRWRDLEPLPPDGALELLQAWGQECAADESAARSICDLVGRLPLAVRLVGRYLAEAQERAADYLSWLEETPLEALDQGQRREESVPLLLERSLAQVSEPARQTLSVAGALALASFGREVVAAGLGVEVGQVGRWLGELVNYGLLQRRGDRHEVSHALIHRYARERVELPGEAVERVAGYYTGLAEEQSELGPAGYVVLDRERGHLMAVLAACVGRQAWEAVQSLAGAVDRYLDICGYWIELVMALEAGLKAVRGLGHRQDEGAFLGNLGNSYSALGQVERAIELYQQALTITREIGDRRGEVAQLGNLGLACSDLGQVERAIEFYQQALTISREIGDRRSEGSVLGNLGSAYSDLGQVERAIELYQQALTISREIGDRRGEGSWLANLGIAYYVLGQVERAIELYQQALTISREIGDRRNEGNQLGNLGNAYRDLGQVERAIDYYEQALTIAREIGDQGNEGNQLGNLGNAYRDLGQVERAIELYQQALVISREIGNRRGEGSWLGNLGVTYSALGQVERAIELYQQALTITREIGDQRNEGVWLGNLGLAYSDLGQVERAIEFYQQALTISREIGDRGNEGNQFGNLGLAYSDLGQVERAIALYQQALTITREIGNRRGEGNRLGNLGVAYRDLGQVERAIEFYQQALTISREIGDRRNEGNQLGNLGNAYRDLGQVERAIELYQQALSIFRDIVDRRGEGYSLANLGIAYHILGQVERVRQCWLQSLAIFREIRSPNAALVQEWLDELGSIG